MAVLDRPAERERPSAPPNPEAIFAEAHRRGRRRRALWALAAVAGIGLLGLLLGLLWNPSGRGAITDRSPARAARPGADSVPNVVVAWGDYQGALHLGDLATGRQRTINAVPSAAAVGGVMVENHGRLLWTDGKEIRAADVATGRTRRVARGYGVIASPDGTRLYIDQGTVDFLELNAATLRVIGRLGLPRQWASNPWVATPIAGGFILMHGGRQIVLGIWHPGSGVRRLGAASDMVLTTYTARSGRYSLVAWLPECVRSTRWPFAGCPLAITNTATGRTVRVHSPNGRGFTGGAFSPGGTQLATFVNTDSPSDPVNTPTSELAIVDTTTGAVHVDPRTHMSTTEDAAWARWLPSGRQLLAGAITATYLVNARSLATRPMYCDGTATRTVSIMTSQDLNFSTQVVPASELSAKQRRALGIADGLRTESTR